MRATVIIPARWDSARLPGKPLLPLLGRPMLQWVVEAVLTSDSAPRVMVATDDERIFAAALDFGAEAIMTRSDHQTGTDRIAEVAAGLDDEVIVNVQGDEPLFESRLLDALLAVHASDVHAPVSTLVIPGDPERYEDPNCVKAVLDHNGRALYFTRASVPAVAKGEPPPPYWQHLGVYAYDRGYLLSLVERSPGPLESRERLEQLRVLEAGDAIAVGKVTDWSGTAVDVIQDVARAEASLRARGEIAPPY